MDTSRRLNHVHENNNGNHWVHGIKKDMIETDFSIEDVGLTQEKIGMENHTSVSYTHLDVYKRQTVTTADATSTTPTTHLSATAAATIAERSPFVDPSRRRATRLL